MKRITRLEDRSPTFMGLWWWSFIGDFHESGYGNAGHDDGCGRDGGHVRDHVHGYADGHDDVLLYFLV